jgi:Flp pilus assembly protein TadD
MSRAVATRTQSIDARLEAARAHDEAGRTKKAEALYRQILSKDSRHAGALHALGLIARKGGHPERAVQLLSKAASAAPWDAAVHCDLGNALKALGRFGEAMAHHRRVVELCPTSPEALSNLGTTCAKAGELDEAFALLGKAADLSPANAELHFNLGNVCLAAGRFEDAARSLERAAELSPRHVRGLTNLGVAYKELGRLDDAEDRFRAALALAPDNADAGWNLALARLMKGDWRAGWADYERRRDISGFAMRRPDRPAWDGAPLDGRSLLVHAEQGFGDTFQFWRYLPRLAKEHAGVSFWCQDALASFLKGQCDRLAVVSEPLPRTDLHAPLLSLPYLLDTASPLVTEPSAYLRADADRIVRWRDAFAGLDFNVGIAWQGRADYAADARRSIPLHHFAPLAEVPKVRLVSLQKGDGAAQLSTVEWRERVRDFGPDLDRDAAFLDTAAIISELDLVITSDTAIAHLAGALGARVWLALAHVPDWRWGLAGETTPWYPTMRLFRQDRPGDWEGVFARIAAALEKR